MHDFIIPELGPSSGPLSDGIVLGRVNQSLLTAALSNAMVAPTVYAIRKDVTGSTFTFSDESAPAGNDTVDDFLPWGTTTQMTTGDELFLACDSPIAEIYVRISTPGVWTGAGLEILYSNNGATPNVAVSVLNDGSNGFRNAAGVYRISFTVPTDLQAFSPVPGSIASRRWLVLRPKGLTSVTSEPRLTRVWIIHADSAVTYTDYTASYNATLNDATFADASNSIFYPVGTERIWTFPFLAYGMDHTIHRRLPVTPTVAAEYLASDGAWKNLADYTTGSVFFNQGPVNLGDTRQIHIERWTIPPDWSSRTLTLALSGGNQSFTGYHMRHRLTAITPLGPVVPSLVRSRVRAFGEGNSIGFRWHNAQTFRGVTLGRFRRVAVGQSRIQLINNLTGAAQTITIPATETGDVPFHANLTTAMIDVSSLLVAYLDGAALQSIQMSLQN